MEHILRVGGSGLFLLVRIVVVLNEFVQILLQQGHQIFTVEKSELDKLESRFLAHFLTLFADEIGLFIGVVHLNHNHEHV